MACLCQRADYLDYPHDGSAADKLFWGATAEQIAECIHGLKNPLAPFYDPKHHGSNEYLALIRRYEAALARIRDRKTHEVVTATK
jgi:hypothetical protein